MPMFEVEQYELHVIKKRVRADTFSEAIKHVMDGKGEFVDHSQELVEVADVYGMPSDANRDIVDGLRELGVTGCGDGIIPGIRSVEEVDDDADDA